MRIILYFHTVIAEDIETQRHGVVVIFAGGEGVAEYFYSDHHDDFVKLIKSRPCRVAVFHQPLPDGPKFKLLGAIWFLLLASKDERVRTKFHGDLSLLETQYNLLTYGIPVHQIPRTSTGNIKTKNHMQWIKTRKAIDKLRESCSDVTSMAFPIIGHPGKHDVLFSKGGNASYQGNMEFLYDVTKRLDDYASNPDRIARQNVRGEIISCVAARGGRFLQLQDGGWWEEVPLDKLHEKITSSIHDCQRKLSVKGPPQQSMDSGTSIFLPSNKRKKVGEDGDPKCECRFV